MVVATVALVVVAVGLAVALVGAIRRSRAVEEHGRRALEQAAADAAEQRAALQEEIQRRGEKLTRQSQAVERLRRAWQAEREWSRELRSQIARLGDRSGLDGQDGDVRALVLSAAIQLTGGDRGLLLSREDEDNDGDLDLVLADGFDHDPEHSEVVQRFARKVLERDEIVREDDPAGARTPADDEIESLVAIPVYLRDRFHGVVICANRPGGFEDLDDDVLLALGDHAGAALQQGRLRHELQDAHRAAVRILVEAVAAGDAVQHRESSQLTVQALKLAGDLGLDSREREVLICAVLLRGVGNLALPERMLVKPGPLTSDERAMVELHPRIGFNVIGQAPVLQDVATAVLYHHERWDGGGYPAGLAGAEIPRTARVLAVLEAFAAMTHDRPYRAARSLDEACQALVEGAGRQFDPEIVPLLVEEVRRSAAPPSDALAETVVEALPLDPISAADSVLGPLGGPATDALTLLGDHRALQYSVREMVQSGRPFAMAMLQLDGLAEINRNASFLVGDRIIHVAARGARRIAGRFGGNAYRASGRRLALVVPLSGGQQAEALSADIAMEFAVGPEIRHAVVTREDGESGEELIRRAREAVADRA